MATVPFSKLTESFTEEDRCIVKKGKELLLMEYDLISQLRKDQELTQKEVAAILEIRQAAISKLESQEDIPLRTLEKYIRALGGELELRARFPDREVVLRQFTQREVEEVQVH